MDNTKNINLYIWISTIMAFFNCIGQSRQNCKHSSYINCAERAKIVSVISLGSTFMVLSFNPDFIVTNLSIIIYFLLIFYNIF